MNYFAYGSNLDIDRMKERCPSAVVISSAYLPKAVLVFNKLGADYSGKANVLRTSHRKDIVYGVIYDIPESEFPDLDAAEGYPTHYDRKIITVYVPVVGAKTKRKKCWIYFATAKYTSSIPLKPSIDYLDHITYGAAYHNLPQPMIDKLKQVECRIPPKKSVSKKLVNTKSKYSTDYKKGIADIIDVLKNLRTKIELLSNKDFERLITFYEACYKDSIPRRIIKWRNVSTTERFRKFATNYIMGIHPILGDDGLIYFLREFFTGIDSLKR